MRRLSRVLGWAGLGVVVTAGLALLIFHDPPNTEAHIARECRFVAALEAKRMVRWKDYGPVPFEIWRAEDRTSGAARADLAPKTWKAGLPVSWRSILIQWLAPKEDLPPIDCTKALDEMQVPKVIKYNDGPAEQVARFQYSRITFLPGDRYALFKESFCEQDQNGWDQYGRIRVWRRHGANWEPASSYDELAVYMSPRFKPPMRCFEWRGP